MNYSRMDTYFTAVLGTRKIIIPWLTYFTLLLILANDIQLNPGPINSIVDYEDYKKQMIHSNDAMKICLLNARNLVNKRMEFENLVNDHGKNAIFAITETWFTESDSPSAWCVDHDTYEVFFQNRNLSFTGRSKGGGVMLLIPKSLKPKLRTNLAEIQPMFESLWVECNSVHASGDRVLINVSYCPHKCYNDVFFDQLASDVSAAYSERKEVFLLGDYNCDYLNSNDANKISVFPEDF